MQKSFLLLLSFCTMVACNPTPTWKSYTYADQIVTVQNGVITSEHETEIDTSKMEFVIETNCTIAEGAAHERHAKNKFAEFQKKVEKIRPTKTDFCVGDPTAPIEFHFVHKEMGSIPLEWGVEMQKFDSTHVRLSSIGYIMRSQRQQIVMYEVDKDSTVLYHGYNNLLYSQLMANLPD